MREKSQEWPQNEVFKVFGKNLIHSDMLFLLKYESVYGLLTFWKNDIFAGLCRTLIFSSVITKNSSWEVLIKNSITF